MELGAADLLSEVEDARLGQPQLVAVPDLLPRPVAEYPASPWGRLKDAARLDLHWFIAAGAESFNQTLESLRYGGQSPLTRRRGLDLALTLVLSVQAFASTSLNEVKILVHDMELTVPLS